MKMPLLTKLVIVLMIFGTLTVACAWVHHHIWQQGYDDATGEWKKKEKLAADAAEKAQAQADAQHAEAISALQAQLDAIDQRRKQENTDAQVQIVRLRHDADAGRLSIAAATTCPADHAEASASATAPAGTGGQARCELDPTAANALVSIASDGDAAIRQANALIDANAATIAACAAATELPPEAQ